MIKQAAGHLPGLHLAAPFSPNHILVCRTVNKRLDPLPLFFSPNFLNPYHAPPPSARRAIPPFLGSSCLAPPSAVDQPLPIKPLAGVGAAVDSGKPPGRRSGVVSVWLLEKVKIPFPLLSCYSMEAGRRQAKQCRRGVRDHCSYYMVITAREMRVNHYVWMYMLWKAPLLFA